MKTTFYLSLTATQAPLIHAIKAKLDSKMPNNNQHLNLPAECLKSLSKIVGIYSRDGRGRNAKPTIAITVSQIKYIVEILIPALSSLNFRRSAGEAGEAGLRSWLLRIKNIGIF
jgi:hypothetical protein